MTSPPAPEVPLTGEGPRYHHSAAAAAQIVNLYLRSDEPTTVIFGKILYLILSSMYEADAELSGQRLQPCDN